MANIKKFLYMSDEGFAREQEPSDSIALGRLTASEITSTHVALGPILKGAAVYLAEVDGVSGVVAASCDSDAAAHAVGVALNTVIAGESCEVVTSGLARGVLSGAASANAVYFLGSDGQPVAQLPIGKRVIVLGYAINGTDLWTQIKDFGKALGGSSSGGIPGGSGGTGGTGGGSFSGGNADTATRLETPRLIALDGDVTGSASFDGTADIVITAIVADDSHQHTYANLTGKPTLGTAAAFNVPAVGNATVGEVVLGSDTRLSSVAEAAKLKSARTITLAGDVTGAVAFDGSSNVTLAAVVADDSHQHTYVNLMGKPTLGTAAAKNVPISGNASSGDVVLGSDTRLSDARVSISHASSHGSAGADPISHQNLSGAGTNTHGQIDSHLAASAPHTGHELLTNKNATNGYAGLISGKVSGAQIPYGTTVNTAAQGNDSRLSDARTPTSHASSHGSAGSDPISHQNLSGAGTNTHGQIDSHLAASAPHTGHEKTAQKGVASGYAGLDSSAKVPEANLPAPKITVGSTEAVSGVEGNVLFVSGGKVAQDSSALHWDSTNNRLGVGTSTPSAALDVVGTAKVSGTATFGDAVVTGGISVAGDVAAGQLHVTGVSGVAAGQYLNAGTGGASTVTGGTGGKGAFSRVGGTGGTVTLAGGIGGNAAGGQDAGVGGDVVITGGAGGSLADATTTTKGGSVRIDGGTTPAYYLVNGVGLVAGGVRVPGDVFIGTNRLHTDNVVVGASSGTQVSINVGSAVIDKEGVVIGGGLVINHADEAADTLSNIFASSALRFGSNSGEAISSTRGVNGVWSLDFYAGFGKKMAITSGNITISTNVVANNGITVGSGGMVIQNGGFTVQADDMLLYGRRLGFFGVTPHVQIVGPSLPDFNNFSLDLSSLKNVGHVLYDIITALRAYGLITSPS